MANQAITDPLTGRAPPRGGQEVPLASSAPWQRRHLGLKWKIFAMLAAAVLCTQAFHLWHAERLISQSTASTEGGVKAILNNFLSF